MNSVALEQVGEAVGLEHDRDAVGRVGLVELDQALASARRATSSRARSRVSRARSCAGRACTAASSARLRPGRLQPLLARREPRDVATAAR